MYCSNQDQNISNAFIHDVLQPTKKSITFSSKNFMYYIISLHLNCNKYVILYSHHYPYVIMIVFYVTHISYFD